MHFYVQFWSTILSMIVFQLTALEKPQVFDSIFCFLVFFIEANANSANSLQKRYNSSICLKFFHIHIYVSTQMMCLCVYSMIFFIYIYNSHVNHPLLFGGWAWVLLQWPKVACYNVKDNVNYKELILKNACLHIK